MRPVYLLDTNVISEFSKPVPNSAIIKRIRENEELCARCSTVWEESNYGLGLMPDGRRKKSVQKTLDDIRDSFEIIPYDNFAARICGEIRAKCRAVGKPAPSYDSQIAATAIANGMVLVTHNTEDFAAVAENSVLRMEDWWE